MKKKIVNLIPYRNLVLTRHVGRSYVTFYDFFNLLIYRQLSHRKRFYFLLLFNLFRWSKM